MNVLTMPSLLADKENVVPSGLLHPSKRATSTAPQKAQLGSTNPKQRAPLLDVTNKSNNIATPSSSQKTRKPLATVVVSTPSSSSSSHKILSTSIATPKLATNSATKPKKSKRVVHRYETNYETNHFAPYIPELDFHPKDLLRPTLIPGAFDGVLELEPPQVDVEEMSVTEPAEVDLESFLQSVTDFVDPPDLSFATDPLVMHDIVIN